MPASIRVTTVWNADSDLLFAVSGDLAGLRFASYSEEELERRLPAAILTLLEAEGYRNVLVSVECLETASRFCPPRFRVTVDHDVAA